MHLLIPFAAPAPSSQAGRDALAALQLPQLASLLMRMHEIDRDNADELAFSPPHERVLARALGWPVADGLLPWAARWAAADGIDVGHAAWGLVSPVHWHLGTDQVSLLDPALLMLDDRTSRALFAAVQPLFAESGWRFEYGHASRWYAAHESLAALRTASLDRVVGRNVDAWLGDAAAARPVRRLQAEVQMLLHTHPRNAAREAGGLLPVNSFWLSACGAARPGAGPEPKVDDRLRGPALAEDWPAWAKAWETLDEGVLLGLDVAMRRGSEVVLTLAGERDAATFVPTRGGFVRRLSSVLRRPAVRPLLESL